MSGQMEKNRVCEVLFAAAWISGEFSELVKLWLEKYVTKGHFRVPKTLTFKMMLGAQPFL